MRERLKAPVTSAERHLELLSYVLSLSLYYARHVFTLVDLLSIVYHLRVSQGHLTISYKNIEVNPDQIKFNPPLDMHLVADSR